MGNVELTDKERLRILAQDLLAAKLKELSDRGIRNIRPDHMSDLARDALTEARLAIDSIDNFLCHGR